MKTPNQSGVDYDLQTLPMVYQTNTTMFGKTTLHRFACSGSATIGNVNLCGVVSFMATSKLQEYTGRQLRKRFGQYGLVENSCPIWLISSKGERLELDFFLDKLSVAVEVQGRQHFEFTPAFHGTRNDFLEQQRRDAEKLAACQARGIQLLYVKKKSEVAELLYTIQARVDQRLNGLEDGNFTGRPSIFWKIDSTPKERGTKRRAQFRTLHGNGSGMYHRAVAGLSSLVEGIDLGVIDPDQTKTRNRVRKHFRTIRRYSTRSWYSPTEENEETFNQASKLIVEWDRQACILMQEVETAARAKADRIAAIKRRFPVDKYPKIQTVYVRDADNNYKTLVENQFALPELEYLAFNRWLYTEKIDGTNTRIHWNCEAETITISGRTDNAQLPAFLFAKLHEMFTVDKFTSSFPDTSVTLYGEGYGARIQKGGGNYIPDGVSFILFDVKIVNWLERSSIVDIAGELGIGVVPVIGSGTLFDAVEMARTGFQSHIGDCLAEGLVMRPEVELANRHGRRIITKIKHKDFAQA